MGPIFLIFLYLTSAYGRVAETGKDRSIVDLDTRSEILVFDIKMLDNLKNTADIFNKFTTESKKTCHSSVDVDNNVVGTDNEPCDENVKIDIGTALILTPLIEQGRTAEAKNASKVDPKLFFGLESYSGFLTVNSTYNSNLFFWYFPSFAKPVSETPWIIWLQGGPGVSSLTGLFDEIGPFSANSDDGNLRFNPYTWLMNHSLVFIDNPVGSGFSFTEHKDGYAKDMATYGKHLHTAAKQLVQIFPELRVAPLYVAGESYAGKYVPALGMEIHRHKDAPGSEFNLKGLIIGNGFVEPGMIKQVVSPYYQFGLLEKEQIEIAQPLVDAFYADIDANRSLEAKQKWNRIVTLLLLMSNQKQAYNFLSDGVLSVGKYSMFLNKPEVKKALHVGDVKFVWVNITVNFALSPDFLSSSQPYFEELLDNNYRVLAYCGQLDQMLPCASSAERYRTWQWKKSNEFLDAPRLPYIHKGKVAGYLKSGGNMTWVVVRGAGHMVPLDKPAAAQRLVAQWISNQPVTTPILLNSQEMLKNFVREGLAVKNTTASENSTIFINL